MKRTAIAMLALLLSIAGCASVDEAQGPGARQDSITTDMSTSHTSHAPDTLISSSSVISHSPADENDSSTDVPEPQPIGTCEGVDSTSDALQLINSGDSVALVDVKIADDPGTVDLHTRVLPVQSADVVAGQLNNGDVGSLEEAAADDSQNILPPGEYLILVGDGSTPDVYFLSDAYSGSFVVNSSGAFQQCSEPGVGYSLVQSGITTVDGLETTFQDAFAASTTSPSPTESGS